MRIAGFKLNPRRRAGAAPIQHGLHQRWEFAGQRQLAVRRIPARRQHEQISPADRDLRQRGRTVVKFRQHPGLGGRWKLQTPMFPEMDVGEIAEARVGKRGEERMSEINLTEQGVITDGLGEFSARADR